MTALLRRGWCLEGMLRANEDGEIVRKQRNDHRHHAIDAFVVANTTQGLLQRFAQAAGSSHESEERLAAVAGSVRPWEGFDLEQVRPFLERMVVSYKLDHGTRDVKDRTTRQLHKATAYGLIELSEDGPSRVVTRKTLDKLKRSDLEPVQGSEPRKGVRDLILRAALLELWYEVGEKADKLAERAANEGVMLGGCRQPVRRVRVVDEQRVIPIKHGPGGQHLKGYLPGGNEFADIWKMRDERWQMVVVPTFAANQEFDLNKLRPHPEAKLLMRLHIDDMGALGEENDRRVVRVRKVSGDHVWLDDHNEANVDARIRKARERRRQGREHEDIKGNKYSGRQLKNLGFRKIGVDEIGRVWDPGPPDS